MYSNMDKAIEGESGLKASDRVPVPLSGVDEEMECGEAAGNDIPQQTQHNSLNAVATNCVSEKQNGDEDYMPQHENVTLVENTRDEAEIGGPTLSGVVTHKDRYVEFLGEHVSVSQPSSDKALSPMSTIQSCTGCEELLDLGRHRDQLNLSGHDEVNESIQSESLIMNVANSAKNVANVDDNDIVEGERGIELECNPVILDVRGNVTDMEGVEEVSNVSCGVTSVENNEQCLRRTISSTITCSEMSGNNSAPNVNRNNATDQPIYVSSVLQSVISNAYRSSDVNPSNPTIESSQPFSTEGGTCRSMAPPTIVCTPSVSRKGMISIIKSTGASIPDSLVGMSKMPRYTISRPTQVSLLSSSGNLYTTMSRHPTPLAHGVSRVGDNKTTGPVSKAQAIQLVVKGPPLNKVQQVIDQVATTVRKNLSSSKIGGSIVSVKNNINNSNVRPVDSNLYYESLLEKIFSNPADHEGMDREDAFATALLLPSKKSREIMSKEFVCSICGEEFYLEDFLQQHFERKVFILTYHCTECKETITFYNKCRFWLHMKTEHQEETSLEKLKEETSSFKLQAYTELEESTVDIAIFKCRYCLRLFDTIDAYTQHFKKFISLSDLNDCKTCGLTLLNSCAALAHQSIHTAGVNDVVCPECGEKISQSSGLKVLFDHLDSCNHFNLSFLISCHCGTSFPSIRAAKLHMLNSHMKQMTKLLDFRCHICQETFRSDARLASHYSTMHGVELPPTVTPPQVQAVLCTLCKKISFDAVTLKNHVESHIMELDATRRKVLSCFLCKKKFPGQSALTSHVDKQHTHRPKRCTICYTLFESRQNLVRHIVSKSCAPGKLPQKLHICIDMPLEKEETLNLLTYKKAFEALENPPQLPVTVTPSSAMKENHISKKSNFIEKLKVSRVCNKNGITEKSKPSEKSIVRSTDRRKFQCHSCKICLVGFHNHQNHMKLHKPSDLARNLSFCGICKKIFDDSVIKSHMEDHQRRGIIVCTHCHSRHFKSMHDAVQHPKKFCFYKEVEGDGSLYIGRKESQNLDEDANSGMIGEMNENEKDNFEMSDASEDFRLEESSVFPCLMCGLAFSSKEEKEDHVSRIHDGTKTVYFCLFCKKKGVRKSFSKKNLISKHISHKHRVVNPSAIASLIYQEEQNVSSGRVVPTELKSLNGEHVPLPKRLRLATEGEFFCGKCGFSSEESKLFEDHIATHNPKKEPQCPECGLCFTVLAALKKHLFAVHKIKAMDEYLEKKGMLIAEEEDQDDFEIEMDDFLPPGTTLTYDSPPRSNRNVSGKRGCTSKSSNGNPLECNVCYRSFQSEAVLKSHMRNHGMAFIRSRRLEKTSD